MFTASDRHVTLLNQAVEPPGDTLPDGKIVQAVAQRMGFVEELAYTDAAAIYDEFKQIRTEHRRVIYAESATRVYVQARANGRVPPRITL